MPLNEYEIDSYIKKIANSSDGLGMDDPYPCQKEFDLLKSEPSKVIGRIKYYLDSFAAGRGDTVGCPTWYYGGKHLIRLLSQINTDESLNLIADTLKTKSNIAEWYWNIQRQSAIGLGNTKDKRWLPVLNESLKDSMAPIDEINEAIEKISDKPCQDPKAILHTADTTMNGLELIEYLYGLNDQIGSWDAEQKGYYYYLLGFNSEKVDALADTDIPKAFYAAQVYENPVNTSLGWMKFDKKPNEENAKLLHEKYPLPDIFEDIKNIIDSKSIKESVEQKNDNIDQSQIIGRINPFDNNVDVKDNLSNNLVETKDVKNETNSVDSKDEGELSKKDQIKSNYLKSMGNSMDTHTKDYDSDLVEVNDEGNVTDYNIISEVFKAAGKYYAIIIGLLLIILGIVSVVSGLGPAILITILVLFIILAAILLIVQFIDSVKSSRDISYKLISSIYILPLLFILVYSSLIYGLMETLMLIGGIIIVGIIGLIILLVCGAFK